MKAAHEGVVGYDGKICDALGCWCRPAMEAKASNLRTLLGEARLSVERDAESNCVCEAGRPQCKYCKPIRGLLERIDIALAAQDETPTPARWCKRFADDPDAPGCCIGCGEAREAHETPAPQRYNIVATTKGSVITLKSPNGEWVRHEDLQVKTGEDVQAGAT